MLSKSIICLLKRVINASHYIFNDTSSKLGLCLTCWVMKVV